MRLIDADEMLEDVRQQIDFLYSFEIDELVECGRIIYNGIIQEIEKMPTIDAVEVVRCENCKHYKPSTVVSRKMCFRKDVDGVQVCYDFKPDDFCRYGERKEDEIDLCE